MNLFAIYIGGTHSKSLIELHDIRFIIANTIEETYASLRDSWWGIPSSLHLDAWGILNYADGHDVIISTKAPINESKQLYFVNLGGYDKNEFTELHKNIFVVASTADEAKQKAVKQVSDWQSPHRDYLYQIDKVYNLHALVADKNYFIHLQENKIFRPFEFICEYKPISQ